MIPLSLGQGEHHIHTICVLISIIASPQERKKAFSTRVPESSGRTYGQQQHKQQQQQQQQQQHQLEPPFKVPSNDSVAFSTTVIKHQATGRQWCCFLCKCKKHQGLKQQEDNSSSLPAACFPISICKSIPAFLICNQLTQFPVNWKSKLSSEIKPTFTISKLCKKSEQYFCFCRSILWLTKSST